jgi:ribosome maturation protein Sdo1
MRIVEGNSAITDRIQVALEFILDRVANTVFGQKHGISSLQKKAMEAICLADENMLMELFSKGKKERTRYTRLEIQEEDARKICEIIREEAASLGITDLKSHYEIAVKEKKSNIINLIVRTKHPIYFASRAQLAPYSFLDYFYKTTEQSDVVSKILKYRLNYSSMER